MNLLYNISKILLLEQDSKISDLRKAIIDRKPISIEYSGPPGEVLSGPRYDIEPIIMGTNAKSGNLVIWAYVFRGTSKKGLPGWKMFRVDRINSIDTSKFDGDSFKLSNLPGYQPGKAPNAMKSLSRVDIYSPYWFEGYKRNKNKPSLPPPPKPEYTQTNIENPEPDVEIPDVNVPLDTPESPDLISHRLDVIVFNDLKQKVKIIDGQKMVSLKDYNDALKDLYNKKQNEWKNYQRMISGNIKPGEGTRRRFETYGKEEIDNLLSKDNIIVSDEVESTISEIQKRFKDLIFS